MTMIVPDDGKEFQGFHSKLTPQRSVTESSRDMCPNCFSTVFCICCCGFCCACLPCSPYFKVVDENESLVTQYWGKLWREIPQPGVHIVNPCGLKETRVSLKQESIDLKNVKVVDAKGNPVVVSAVVRYRAILAALEVADYKKYLENQATAVLKQICAKYPYFTFDDSPSLKSEARAIQEDMVKNCGVIVLAVDLNEMSYATEIAGMMLIRQQAEARVEARDVIVVGAVGIVTKAMQRLEQSGQKLTDQERSKTISNLLTVLCSDSAAQPVIPTNTN